MDNPATVASKKKAKPEKNDEPYDTIKQYMLCKKKQKAPMRPIVRLTTYCMMRRKIMTYNDSSRAPTVNRTL
eukprot:Skav202962  [mRNA]  locus=scaffold2274:338116:339902:- [translate_table: standard]